jgi:hypothetical protein
MESRRDAVVGGYLRRGDISTAEQSRGTVDQLEDEVEEIY